MFPLSAIALFAAVVALLVQLTAGAVQQITDYRALSRRSDATELAEAIQRFTTERGVQPASLDLLANTPGFEYTRGARNPWQATATATTLSDGVWQYARFVLISRDPSDGVTAADYAADNRCGAGAAAAAMSWCGGPSADWYRHETREDYQAQLATQRGRQQRLLQLFADAYSAAGAFPSVDAGGALLPAGSGTPLATLAGAPASASACTGTHTYAGIPLDCTQLFDTWGGPIAYQFQGPRHILIVSETPFRTAAGITVLVASDLNVP